MKIRLLQIAALGFCACSGGGNGPVSLHDLHLPAVTANPPTATNDFYALPYPNDLRMDADGTIALGSYPRDGGLLEQYVDVFDQRVTGFGTASAIYFRFDGAIDPASLPADPESSIAAGATAFVVDVTPTSPTFGMKRPVIAHFVADSGQFIGPNWVALLPFPGVPLREKTTYAAVLTDGVRGTNGSSVRRDRDFQSVLQNAAQDPVLQTAAHAYAPFLTWLASQGDLEKHVMNATVFTTVDATSEMFKLRDAVYSQAPQPVLAGVTAKDSGATYQVYEATYEAPNFQTGNPPYMPSGGDIVTDSNGVPQVQRTETLRVAMTIPKGAMPANGWPIVLYSHGTGGDYRTFIDDGSGPEAASVTDASGNVIAQLAMISIDAELNGARVPAGTNVDLAFFNFQNPIAGLANVKQGAVDDFSLLRLVKALDPQTAAQQGLPFAFDPTKIYFKGHSQGGTTGPLFLAAEPEVKGAILSGAGAVIMQALLSKTKPVDITKVVGAVLQDPVDQFHPFLSQVQNYFETSDPVNYGRLFFQEPPQGFAPKPIFQSLGLVDTYAPPPTIKALALAMGVQPVNPIVEPDQGGTIDGLDLVGQSWANAPVTNNVAGGKATGVLLEYAQAGSDDGHFVIFDVPAAIAQNNRFLATLAATGTATLTTP